MIKIVTFLDLKLEDEDAIVSCSGCLYFGRNDGNHNCCRRHAARLMSANSEWGRWPLVNASDFCGEYTQLETDD